MLSLSQIPVHMLKVDNMMLSDMKYLPFVKKKKI